MAPRNALLRHLGALAASPRHATTGLAGIPMRPLVALLDEVEAGTWRPDDALRLLDLLARDARPTLRRHVVMVAADRAGALPPGRLEALFRALADDPSRLVAAAVRGRLGDWLAALDPHEQEGVLDRWSAAGSDGARLALATALAAPWSLAGAEHAIEVLATDDMPDVRAATAAAAGVRLEEDWSPFGEILERLADDPCPEVRRGARAALGSVYRPRQPAYDDDSGVEAGVWS